MLTKAQAAGMMRAVADYVRDAVAKAVAPLAERIAAVEARQPEKGEDGKSVTLDDVAPLIEARVAKAVADIPKPRDGEDGKSVTVDDLKPLIDEAVAALPKPVDGRDVDPAEIAAMVDKAVAALPKPKDGEDGKSVTLEDVRPLIDEAMAVLPKPKDGKDADEATIIKAVLDAIPPVKDGVGLAGALIDKDGNLVVTLTNGATHPLGRVVGKDGEPGADGLGFEDMEETVEDGGRVIVRRYRRGEQVREFRHKIGVTLYRNIFKQGTTYEPGDLVTWGGCLWHCNAETADKPGAGSSAWTLATKRGNDGRSVSMDDLKPFISSEIDKAVEAALRKREKK